MKFQGVVHVVNTMFGRTLLAVALFLPSAVRAESLRRVEIIGGYQYTVEYTPKADGTLGVNVTHLLTNRGWQPIAAENKIDFEPAKLSGEGRTIVLNGKQYSVRFSTGDNFKVGGENYAVAKDGQWKYLEGKGLIPQKLIDEEKAKAAERAKQAAQTPAKPSVEAKPAVAAAQPLKTAPQGPPAGSGITVVPPTPPKPLGTFGKPTPGRDTTLAEVRVSENLINQFQVTTKQDRPYLDGMTGLMVYPNVDINVRPALTDSSNSIATRVNVGVSGSAYTHGSAARVRAGAEVTTAISANLSKDVYVSPQGSVSATGLRGSVNMVPSISAYGPLGGRVAGRKAARQTAAALPSKKAELYNKVNRGIDNAIVQGNGLLNQNLRDLSTFEDEAIKSMLDPHFSSQGRHGSQPGFISAELKADLDKKLEPRPALKTPEKAAVTAYLHEEAFRKAIAPQLAGQRVNLFEAMQIICKNPFSKRLDLCSAKKKDPKEQAAIEADLKKTTLEFDKDEPFEVSFRDGKLKFVLNAQHDLVTPDMPLKVTRPGVKARVEVVYAVSPSGLKRESLTVRERPEAGKAVARASANGDTEVSHAGVGTPATPAEDPRKQPSLLEGFYNFAVKSGELVTVQSKYEKSFAEAFDFPRINLPKTSYSPGEGTKPYPTSWMQIAPLDAQSENGWLAISAQSVATK